MWMGDFHSAVSQHQFHFRPDKRSVLNGKEYCLWGPAQQKMLIERQHFPVSNIYTIRVSNNHGSLALEKDDIENCDKGMTFIDRGGGIVSTSFVDLEHTLCRVKASWHDCQRIFFLRIRCNL